MSYLKILEDFEAFESYNNLGKELYSKNKQILKEVNKYFKNKIFTIEQDLYQYNLTSSGTNYKGRKCKIDCATFSNNDGHLCFTFHIQNLKTLKYDIYHHWFEPYTIFFKEE